MGFHARRFQRNRRYQERLKMNVENIRKVATVIQAQPHASLFKESAQGFLMSRYYHPCGTPACIAGWSHALAAPDFDPFALPQAEPELSEIQSVAAEYLGLPLDLAVREVFRGTDSQGDLARITPTMAADFLNNLADTGIADWKRVGYDPE